MSEEEYNNRIGKINAEISTDRVDADREHYLLLQKLYLKDRYIEGLQQKVEQLEKDKSYANWYAVKKEKKVEQLENIRKEAIEYTDNLIIFDGHNYGLYDCYINVKNDLLNILNKGSEE